MDADLAVNQADAVHKVTDPVGAETDLQGIPVPKLIRVFAIVLYVVRHLNPHVQVPVVPGKAGVSGDSFASHCPFLADAGDFRPVDLSLGRSLDGAVEGNLVFKHAFGPVVGPDQDIHLRIRLPGGQIAGQRLHGKVKPADLSGSQGNGREREVVGKQPGGGGVGKGKGIGHRLFRDIFNGQFDLPAVGGIHRGGRHRRVVADGRLADIRAVDVTRLRGELHLGLRVLRIDVVRNLHVIRAVNPYGGRPVVLNPLAGAEVVVQDLDLLRTANIQRIVRVAVAHNVVLYPDIPMHQHRGVGARRAVAFNGDGAGNELVAVEAGVFKTVVGDLQVLYITALVPAIGDLRLDQDGGHPHVADGAVGDSAVGRLDQEAAGPGGIHQAVVKQEARAVGGEVFNQRAVLQTHIPVEGKDIRLVAGGLRFRRHGCTGDQLACASEEQRGVARAEIRGQAGIVVVAGGIGQGFGLRIVAQHLAELAADVGAVVGHVLKQAADHLRANPHIGAVGRVAGRDQRRRPAQPALLIGPEQIAAVLALIEVLRQHGSRLGGDGHAVQLRAAVAVALLEAEARAADDAEILKADIAAVLQDNHAGAVAANRNLSADLELLPPVVFQHAAVLPAAEIGDALEADVGERRILARTERFDIQFGCRRIIGGVRQVGQIAGVGLDDHVAVALFDHGPLAVGIQPMADVQTINRHIPAVVHGEDGAGILLKLHRHAVSVQGVIRHARQGKDIRRVQPRRHNPVGLVTGGEAEIPFQGQRLIQCAHRGFVLHAREDFHIGFGQKILVDAVLPAHRRVVQVVPVRVGGTVGSNAVFGLVVLRQQVIHALSGNAARDGVFRQGDADAALHGNLIRCVEQQDHVAPLRHGDAARHLVEGDQNVLQPCGKGNAALQLIVLHHGLAAAELYGRTVRRQRVVQDQRAGGDSVHDRRRVFGGVDYTAGGERRSRRLHGAAVVKHNRAGGESAFNPAVDQVGLRAFPAVDAVNRMIGRAPDFRVFQRQPRAVPGVDGFLGG